MVVNIPIVTLDKIYIKTDERNVYFLDCTRINGTNEIVSRGNESLDSQIDRLSKTINNKKIILADDVIFSGSVINNIISRFNEKNIEIIQVISSICSMKGYCYFKEKLKYGIKTNYLMSDDIIDQVCERDFYFGIAGSGIMIRSENGLYKAPYFMPYGNPNERASIPINKQLEFSKSCLRRSIYLWEEIDKLKNKNTLIKELPEVIINTNKNKEIVKTLKKEMKKL